MRDLRRFADFLRREARTYRDPPSTPADLIWRQVDKRMRGDRETEAAIATSGALPNPDTDPDDHFVAGTLAYNDPPPAPRAEMWRRIKAIQELRRAEVDGASDRRQPARPWWAKGRRTVGWVAVVGAAPLAVGIAVGGGEEGGPTAVSTGPTTGTAPTQATAPLQSPTQPPGPPEPAAPETRVAASPIQSATSPEPNPLEGTVRQAVTPGPRVVSASPSRSRRYGETAGYLGRAETLLTALRVDRRTPASEEELARRARDLLIETRMQLDGPGPRTSEEATLLGDLELVLLQVARLGTGATDLEWQLARESMDWRLTLPRLRAAGAAEGL